MLALASECFYPLCGGLEMKISAEAAARDLRNWPLPLCLEIFVGSSIPPSTYTGYKIEEGCLPDEMCVETNDGPKYVPWLASTFDASSGRLTVESRYGHRYEFRFFVLN
jgi:hypothetical protein